MNFGLHVAPSVRSLTFKIGFFMSHSWAAQTLRPNTQADELFQFDVINVLKYVPTPTLTTRNVTKTDCSVNFLEKVLTAPCTEAPKSSSWQAHLGL